MNLLDNPTPVTEEQAQENLVEEFTDVMACARDLELHDDPRIEFEKKTRFYARLLKRDAENEH